MASEGGSRDGNITQAELDSIKKELEERLAAVQKEKEKAEQLAEKFRKDNDEARTIIQGKASELDVLKKKLGEQPNDKKGSDNDVTLAELEADMTDEEWQIADKFLETVQDPMLKRKLVNDEKERLKVLKMIKVDAEVQPVPSSFRRESNSQKSEDVNKSVKELFDNFKKSHGFVPPGPGSSVRSGGYSNGNSFGNNEWPSDKSRKQDSRVR